MAGAFSPIRPVDHRHGAGLRRRRTARGRRGRDRRDRGSAAGGAPAGAGKHFARRARSCRGGCAPSFRGARRTRAGSLGGAWQRPGTPDRDPLPGAGRGRGLRRLPAAGRRHPCTPGRLLQHEPVHRAGHRAGAGRRSGARARQCAVRIECAARHGQRGDAGAGCNTPCFARGGRRQFLPGQRPLGRRCRRTVAGVLHLRRRRRLARRLGLPAGQVARQARSIMDGRGRRAGLHGHGPRPGHRGIHHRLRCL